MRQPMGRLHIVLKMKHHDDWDRDALGSTTALDGARRNDATHASLGPRKLVTALHAGDGTIMRVQDLPKVLEKLATSESHRARDRAPA